MRILVYLLLLIGVQGAMTRLLPASVSPPDLFLLTAVALAFRWRPLPALLAAYLVGLVQDVLSHASLLGLHAAAVAGGVLLVLGLRRFLASDGFLQTVLSVTAATVGQWAAFLILTYWLRNDLVTVTTLSTVLPAALVGTLVLAPIVERFATWAFGPRASVEEGLA